MSGSNGLVSGARAPEPPTAVAWSRLNPRMLFVHPVRELVRFIPAFLITFFIGTQSGDYGWTLTLAGLGVALGVLQWVTTTYRITPTHVEVRRGILNRRTLSVPRDRIRTLDADATLLHRIFRLQVVHIGTGATHAGRDDRLDFNGVSARDQVDLRRELLGRPVEPFASTQATTLVGSPQSRADVRERRRAKSDFGRWKPSWVRYAPFTLSGFAAVAALLGSTLQFGSPLELYRRLPWVQDVVGSTEHLGLALAIVVTVVGLLVVASIIAMARYLLSYAGFSISRPSPQMLHVSHGLLRTRQTSIDETRMRGAQLVEPLSLRLTGAARAEAIMTGLGEERRGSALLLPPGPRAEAVRVSGAVLGTDEPWRCRLEQHGPAARRRRFTRAGVFVLIVALLVAGGVRLGILSMPVWWAFAVIVPAMAWLAEDRYAGLGHMLTPDWLIARNGSLNRRHTALATEGVIGFTVRSSFFQRRAGLVTVIATTAAGAQRYEVPDVPVEVGWDLVEAVLIDRGRGAHAAPPHP